MEKPDDAERLGIFSFLAMVQGTEEVYGHQITHRRIYDPSEVYKGYRFQRLTEEDPKTAATARSRCAGVQSE